MAPSVLDRRPTPHARAPRAELSRPIAVDLFSGAGGMSFGFEQAGFDVVAAVESDPVHASAHRFNFPSTVVIQRDAGLVSADDLRAAVVEGLRRIGRSPAEPVDVVVGGPPCQGFSVGGHLKKDDPRNALVGEFVRMVGALRPRALVLENVPAMANAEEPDSGARVPAWVSQELDRLGYEVSWPHIVNASWYGVPQDRRRLIIVGVERSLELPEIPSRRVAPRPKRSAERPRRGEFGHPDSSVLPPGPTVMDAIGDLPDLDAFEELLEADKVLLPEAVGRAGANSRADYGRTLAGDQRDPTDLSHPRRWNRAYLTSSLRTVHTKEVRQRFAATRPGESDPVSRFYRLDFRGLAPTLRAGSTADRGSYSAPRPIHPCHPRVLSVREAARLQGFPDWFRFTAAKWHGFRQVGNAVPPPMAQAYGEAIRRILGRDEPPQVRRVALGPESLLRVSLGSGRRRGRNAPDRARGPLTRTRP